MARTSKRTPAAPFATLKSDLGQSFPLHRPRGDSLRQLAYLWSYRARHRLRWRDQPEERAKLDEEAAQLLHACGADAAAVAELAKASVVEVQIPWEQEEVNWEVRLLPWEFVIASATRRQRATRAFLVVRHLDRQHKPIGAARRGARKAAALAVSAPGALSARPLAQAARLLPILDGAVRIDDAGHLTQAMLTGQMAAGRPRLVHIAGTDPHHAAQSLGGPDGPTGETSADATIRDGVMLSDERGNPVPVDAGALATALTADGSRPDLVVFAVELSGARTAAHVVAAGARAAIGLQDTLDEQCASTFASELYHVWVNNDRDLLSAVQIAWAAMRALDRDLAGSGVVIWSDRSLVADGRGAIEQRRKEAELRLAQRWADPLPIENEDAARRALRAADHAIAPFERLNYALLHNRQALFEAFELVNHSGQRLDDVQVEVELLGGERGLTYRSTFSVGRRPLTLHEHIAIPLTSSLVRSLSESVRTNLLVKVSLAGHTIYQRSHQVTLLPPNEWVDDDASRQWLPSLVLPSDPGVERILTEAQRYLVTLSMEPDAGFDGYQSLAPQGADPDHGVDLQVAAIWAALQNDLPLDYINPPPTYTIGSQRVRRPGDILRAGRGTCLDLALLLAATLEFIDVYPVVFLLRGHAFPGYWRSPAAWQRFVSFTGGGDETLPRPGDAGGWPWMFGDVHRQAIRDEVIRGALVPIESVWLTQHAGFWDAVDEGWANLQNPAEFDCLVDIKRARERDVTPLPLAGVES